MRQKIRINRTDLKTLVFTNRQDDFNSGQHYPCREFAKAMDSQRDKEEDDGSF